MREESKRVRERKCMCICIYLAKLATCNNNGYCMALFTAMACNGGGKHKSSISGGFKTEAATETNTCLKP